MNLKKKIRDDRKTARRPRTDAENDALIAAILAAPFFNHAKQIAIYAARPWEPDLLALWRLIPDKCFFPRVVPGTFEMEFFRIEAALDLVPGAFGLLEPRPVAENRAGKWHEDTLVLVPGVAFDRFGARIGNGMGFYDRFLATTPAKKWGTGWMAQVIKEKLAQEPTDVRMDAVVTEKGFMRVPW